MLNGSALGVAVGNKPIVIIQVAQFLEHIDIPDKNGILRPAPRSIGSDTVLVGLGPGIHLRGQSHGVGFLCKVTGRQVKEVFHASLLSKMSACSSVIYCQLCGGRVMPMSESGTVEILTGSWTPQT